MSSKGLVSPEQFADSMAIERQWEETARDEYACPIPQCGSAPGVACLSSWPVKMKPVKRLGSAGLSERYSQFSHGARMRLAIRDGLVPTFPGETMEDNERWLSSIDQKSVTRPPA